MSQIVPERVITRRGILSVLVGAGMAASSLGQSPCEWNEVAPSPVAKVEAPTLVIDDRLVSFGGFTTNLIASPTVHAYNPATDGWSSLADMPTPVTHYGIAIDDRTVWVAGGFVGDHPGFVTDEVWTYDVDLDVWSAGPPLPEPRGSGGLFLLGRKLSFVGGVEADRDTDSEKHWILDLDNVAAGWVLAAPLPIPRNHFGAIAFQGRGYVVGGQFRHDTNPQDVDFVSAFDPVSGWTALASLPIPRSHFEPSTFESDGKIVIAGGRANTLGIGAVPEMTAYDPVGNTWAGLATMPTPLLAPGAKRIGDDILLTGGGPTAFTPVTKSYTRAADVGLPSGHLYVNAGGTNLSLAQPWCADAGYLSGKSFSNPGVGDVQSTDSDELYWTERTGSDSSPLAFDYSLALVPGQYRVRLHFAEIFWSSAGKRIFDVRLEGQLVLDDYDITADVGPATAAVHEFDLSVADGALDMEFDASVDRPKLSAYEVIPLSTPPVWNDLGLGLAGTHGIPELHGSGSLLPGSVFNLELLGALENSPGVLVFGFHRIDFPIAGGTLVPSPDGIAIYLTDAVGEVSLSGDWYPTPGLGVFLQAWTVDPGGPQGGAASNGLFANAP